MMSKRERVKNFSEEEKITLIDFVREHKHILESKSSEPKVNKKKKELWERLSDQMRMSGIAQRDSNNLRSAYYRLKQQAKSTVGNYKRNLKKTGGGPGPSSATEPTELDWAIVDISPVDFEEDEPVLDCDDNSTKKNVEQENDLIFEGLIDPSTGIINLVSDKNHPKAENPLNILATSSLKTKTTTSKSKRSKIVGMTETQSKMVSLHERQINEKIEKNNELINSEMLLTRTKLKNEEELHELKKQEMNVKIENELKLKIIRELEIQKLKLEIEKLLLTNK